MIRTNEPFMLQSSPTLLNVSPAMIKEAFCVYEIWQSPELLFVGVCKFTQIGTMPDAYQNSEFVKRIGYDDKMSLRMVAFGTRIQCHNFRARHIRSFPDIPICNLQGSYKRGIKIQCVNDGVVYNNQTECALAYGVSQASISYHLSGRPGYATITGRTFRKVVE